MLSAADILDLLAAGATTKVEDPSRAPLFVPGQPVVTRNLNPRTHTRLPRYCRGKRGVVVKVHGLFALPDVRAIGDEDTREYCYAVRFPMTELWGPQGAAGDSLTIDLWDSYLLPAEGERTT